jgi:hypothetical protein
MQGRESVSNYTSAIGAIECAHYFDDLLPHAPLVPCSYWGYGQEFHLMVQSYEYIAPKRAAKHFETTYCTHAIGIGQLSQSSPNLLEIVAMARVQYEYNTWKCCDID